MSYVTWFGFMAIAWLTSISPGPGAIQAMSHGLNYGWKKTILVIIGQEIALAIIMIIIGLGIKIIITSLYFMMIIRGMGAAWLIYNGYLTWYSSNIIKNDKLNNSVILPSLNKLKQFLKGFITNITNVRMIILMISLVPQFIKTNESLYGQLIIIILTMIVIDGFMMNIYALSASYIQKFIQSPIINNIQNRIFGTALIISGISLILPF